MAARRKETVVDTTPDETEPTLAEIDITNEYALHSGTNMPNHSTTMMGRGTFIRTGAQRPVFRTKQSAYRFAAYLVSMAEVLPDETDPVTWEEMLEAVQNAK